MGSPAFGGSTAALGPRLSAPRRPEPARPRPLPAPRAGGSRRGRGFRRARPCLTGSGSRRGGLFAASLPDVRANQCRGAVAGAGSRGARCQTPTGLCVLHRRSGGVWEDALTWGGALCARRWALGLVGTAPPTLGAWPPAARVWVGPREVHRAGLTLTSARLSGHPRERRGEEAGTGQQRPSSTVSPRSAVGSEQPRDSVDAKVRRLPALLPAAGSAWGGAAGLSVY